MSTGRRIIGTVALVVLVLLIAAGVTLYVISTENGSRTPRVPATNSAPTAAASTGSAHDEHSQSASPSHRSATPETASPSPTALAASAPSATIPQPPPAPATTPPAEHPPTPAPTSPAARPTPHDSRNTDLVLPPGPSGTPEWKQLNIATPDEAVALVSRVEFKNNPDFTYAGFANQDGSFEVVVRSRSLQKGGGSGTVGRYRVTRDGNFTLIQ